MVHSDKTGLRNHWDSLYASQGDTGVSWYQPSTIHSLEWIDTLLPDRTTSVIDVGAGASTFVDELLRRGRQKITLLDQSEVALRLTQERLLANADYAAKLSGINWIHGDLLMSILPRHRFDLWHDRAVFHFFRSKTQRDQYLHRLSHALRPGGYFIVSTFAADGPSHCSGLAVMRYSLDELVSALGADFRLVVQQADRHLTPSGKYQSFLHACFRYQPTMPGG